MNPETPEMCGLHKGVTVSDLSITQDQLCEVVKALAP